MKVYKSYTIRLETGCGNIYITEAVDISGVKLVKLNLGKAGGCVSAHLSVLAELLTFSLNNNNKQVLMNCVGIKCPSMPCCVDIVARFFLDREMEKGGEQIG